MAVVALLWLGVTFLRAVLGFVGFLRAYFFAPLLGLGRLDLTKYGSWAGETLPCSVVKAGDIKLW